MSIRRINGAPARLLAWVATGAGVLACACGCASAAPPGHAFVRVDQLGYASGGPKRAYLLSSVPQTGAKFSVATAGGGATFSGVVGGSLGSWSATYPYVYALDFDPVLGPGSYTVDVTGAASASSPPFPVEPPSQLYQQALGNSLSFYEAQRDGPNVIRSALRTSPAHLNDTHARAYAPPRTRGDGSFSGSLRALRGRVDASGGWADAGDYLKFVQTASYTVDLLLVGVRDFPSEMGAAAPNSDFRAETSFGLDWLLRMWNDRTRTLYFQVGIGSGNGSAVADHDLWRLPQADDHYGGANSRYRYIRNRPVFRAAAAGSRISPNLAGRLAAAFGLCFQVFRTSSPALADKCLLAGEHVFALADSHPRHLLTVLPYGFYPESEWRDDLELGATELATAVSLGGLPQGLAHTQPAYYLRQAATWAKAYMSRPGEGTDPLNLYDVSGLAHYELYRSIMRLRATGLALTPAALVADLGRQLTNAQSVGHSDPFGFGFAWSDADTVSHGAGLSVMASEYAQLTGNQQYRQLSVRWLDDILGANAWGASFIVGDGVDFPHCLQHQVANLAGSLTGAGPVLAGAAVEGPTGSATSGSLARMRRCPPAGGDAFAQFNGHHAVFKDNVQSYSTVEPAIDLTASSPLAFAWLVSEGL